jgi:hypothetical protein
MFIEEICGKRPATNGFMILDEAQSSSYVDFKNDNGVDIESFEDLAAVSVCKVFMPTI